MTRRRVRVAEVVARALITTGGVGTILAVTLLFVYLVVVVAPLFRGPSAGEERDVALAADAAEPWVDGGVDEYAVVAWVLDRRGRLAWFRLDDGAQLGSRVLFETEPSTGSSISARGDFAFGFADGTAVVGRVACGAESVPFDEIGPELREMEVGARKVLDGALVERLGRDQFRRVAVAAELGDPISVASGRPLRELDAVRRGSDLSLAALVDGGDVVVVDKQSFDNLLTGEIESEYVRSDVPIDAAEQGAPSHLLLTGNTNSLLLAFRDGQLWRLDLRDRAAPRLAETVDLVDEPGETLEALGFLIGRATLVAGSSTGELSTWFEATGAEDGVPPHLVNVRRFAGPDAPVRRLASSPRSRLVAAAYADGSVRLFQATTGRRLVELPGGGSDAVRVLSIAPREDRLLALEDGLARVHDVRPGYHEATLSTLFTPVWYENHSRPGHVWESTGGSDDFEPKLGLFPLVFGTIKATFYSMILGVPLALLAAVYTSEFLSRKLRAPIQSAIELMATLPSVVLGFLAATVIAPWVQGEIASVIASLYVVPLCFLLFAHLFQLLPRRTIVLLAGWPRFALMFLALFPAIALAGAIGPPLERALFAGDVEVWLNGQVGGGFGGFLLILLPLAGLVAVALARRFLDPGIIERVNDWSRLRFGLTALARFAGLLVVALGLSAAAAAGLVAAGFDPRGGAFGVGTYEQKNALVVGFVMGFAIVPIVYTLAVDALTSVPEHLREASYAAGGTHWQTAVRVVVPTAASGLYSACMIGLGRAVGETMIVLMATGSTAIIEWNVFNGFRTLSANIAIELPEAVKGSTHYRTLFLAALLLFAMTFVLNTIAEFVRQRSRKRFVQL